MQPRQARRGTTAVAAVSLLLGSVLVILVFALSACGASTPSSAATSLPAGSSAVSSNPATTTAATTTPPGTSAPATGAPVSSPAPATPADPADPGTRAAVPVASVATFAPGVTATVISIEPLTATARLPGEMAGPAVRLAVAFQNNGSAPVDLGNVTVDLQDAAKSSATPLSGNGAAPFSGTAAPGAFVTGVYVFSLPVVDRAGVSLYVTCNADLPVVVFTGDLS